VNPDQDYGDLPAPTIPQLDPLAAPLPAPNPSDPFGSLLELDPEIPTPGGAPTQPKNLRIDLIANDWAEFSWAPSNDDGEVVAYRVYRSDGRTYTVSKNQTSANAGTQAQLDKNWQTTSFIDCNYTRFLHQIYNCAQFGPAPGNIFSYQVTAVDDDGNESAASNTITINYHEAAGAPVPVYQDQFLDGSGFAQNHDLSNTAYFIDKFQLVFEDDFDGTSIDRTRWNTSLLWGDQTIINQEQQYFVDSQNKVDFGYDPFNIANSILSIEAVPTPETLKSSLPDVCHEFDDPARPRCAFLSGALSTHDKFNLTFGYVEARMKTSGIAGALSSFYLYHRYPGEGLQRHAPEIDIVEYLGENPFGDEDAFQTYHYADINTGITRSSPTMIHKNPDGSKYSDDWHTYSVLWEPQLAIWYIDGKEIKRLSGPQMSRQAMNIVTYLVAGSGWAPTPDLDGDFPLKFEIDYIRAYQRDAFMGNGLYPATD
jgi:beta-glucanase (GH16 family)